MPKLSKILDDRYYEAIIQLRPKNDKLLRFVENQVKKRKNVFISKIIDKKYGFDIYLSNQRYARSIGKRLKENFNGNLKISKSLHSRDRQTSKDIYRSTICFRLKN